MRGPKYYILDNENHPVAVDFLTWAIWFEDGNRVVDYTQITSDVLVSTVFLGIDHRFIGDGPPILFETMIFGGELDDMQLRYASWDDAATGHKVIVGRMRAKQATHSGAVGGDDDNK